MEEQVMQEQTSLETLSIKVSEMINQYNSLKDENEMLRNEMVALRSAKELKEQEIENLTEQNLMKDLEIEEIVNKIESIVG